MNIRELTCIGCPMGCQPVSYTHLDVYKRQVYNGKKIKARSRQNVEIPHIVL